MVSLRLDFSGTEGTHRKEALVVGDCQVDGPNAPAVKSPEELAGRFQAELVTSLPLWKDRLRSNPEALGALEHDVRTAFAHGADLLVIDLLASVMKQKAFDEACERTRKDFAYPLERGRMRPIRVRLLGGVLMWVTSLSCPPRSSRRRDSEERVPGAYVELMQFGLGKGCAPGLQSKVARQAALGPSLSFAQQELARDGIELDVKTRWRITAQCGGGLLWLHCFELQMWRDGKLLVGDELAGKSVWVQIDGGRTRIPGDLQVATPAKEVTDADGLPVENTPGRARKRPQLTFDGEWRDPKLLTIFVHEKQGRMVKKSATAVDGTFLGPDALAELVEMHLNGLEATKPTSVTFVSDGSIWIWERIPAIVRLAKPSPVPMFEVLDCYHTAITSRWRWPRWD